jgi:circadian clock protein KaiC
MVTEYVAGGARKKERSILFAFEESREQLFRNAVGWNNDFEELEKQELLKVVCVYPETQGLEDHLICIKEHIEKYKPQRVAIDSLSALERVATLKGFREFVIGLTSYIKQKEIVGLFTATTEGLMGGTSITEAHISTITDTIILLRYIEMYGEMRRGLTVLKMRGSMHEKEIRELMIDQTGMHIGKPFRNITGVLTGRPEYLDMTELEMLDRMFRVESKSSGDGTA